MNLVFKSAEIHCDMGDILRVEAKVKEPGDMGPKVLITLEVQTFNDPPPGAYDPQPVTYIDMPRETALRLHSALETALMMTYDHRLHLDGAEPAQLGERAQAAQKVPNTEAPKP